VLSSLKRHTEAAEAFGQAAALVEAGGPGSPAWTLHLLRGGALERANRWAEAEPVLERALALAPNNPVVLNYLGYARLERGADLAGAEALIAKASALRPNDPSITDSLGWAQFRRGRYGEAIATLTRAAAGDPGQAEIHEHLGDALYAAGRRFEARFAWEAARVVAEDEEVAGRIRGKLANGLPTAATATQ
jgi:Flp pilus assembly protein TadD